MTAQEKLEKRLVDLLEQEPDWKIVARGFETRLLEESSISWLPQSREVCWAWVSEILELMRSLDNWGERYEYAASREEHLLNAEELLLSLLPNNNTLD